jgi:hypothetical protein
MAMPPSFQPPESKSGFKVLPILTTMIGIILLLIRIITGKGVPSPQEMREQEHPIPHPTYTLPRR